jgi:hypothetical protein
MAKKVNLKAKAKRQKIMAGGGAVLLVAILAVQVPRTMKMLNPPVTQPPPPSATPVPVGADPSVLPTPGSAVSATPVSATSGPLSDTDPPPQAGSGQLVAFGRFASKDPFAQQVDPDATVAAGVTADGETPVGSKEAPAVPKDTPAAPTVTPVATPDEPGVVTPTATGPVSSVVIAVNGAEETVALKGEFPKAEPIFRLVSATATSARIGIAGGALASGEATVTLRKGKPLTLVNTADGTRYELLLVGVA